MNPLDLRGAWLALLLATPVLCHGGHEVPEGVVISEDPIVRLPSTIWLHSPPGLVAD